MIVVLADDFSGAAEVAGIALRYGLSVEILPDLESPSDAGLIVIDSNTRAGSAEEARIVITALSRQIKRQTPEWVYKKIDSVLRGHILFELQAMASVLNKPCILIVPANPSQRRIVKEGCYTIDGIPLDQTVFAADPEFPRLTANISELLPGVSCLKNLPETAYVVNNCTGPALAEAADMSDIRHWAKSVTPDVLPAGAADFFCALLEINRPKPQCAAVQKKYKAGNKRLIISGSLASQTRALLNKRDKKGYAHCPLTPLSSDDSDSFPSQLNRWTNQVLSAFEQKQHVIAYVSQTVDERYTDGKKMIHLIAEMVRSVIQQVRIDELVIEGGSTASQILCALNWQRVKPVLELAPGVVVLHLFDDMQLQLVVKPGSYPWPEQL